VGLLLRYLWYGLIVRTVVLIVLGLNVRHRERLPLKGPAILAANHNSHLDAMVLISLFPLHLLPKVRPVAAADYFLRNPLLAWFATQVIGIVPPKRKREREDEDLLAPVNDALARGEILLFFPEGSRGEPEQIAEFKSGVARLAERHPEVPIVPIFMHGLGKALPRGDWVLVPFFLDAWIGESLRFSGTRDEFMQRYRDSMQALAQEEQHSQWL
jgi:1-acyl-sn-glycerol-3-phosphate acyltransferase